VTTLDDVTSPRVLVLQPDQGDPVGPLGEWLTGAGADLDVRQPAELPADLDGYAGVVCLGGAMGATDDLDYPWLADLRRLLSQAVTRQLPTLGICLGAQLLAVATGGRVEVGQDGPEAGGLLVAKRDLGWTDPLFAELPLMPDVLHFHSDVVATLPAGAVLLASSTRYPNQAFRVGRCAYGLQFHIETTPEIVRSWARGNPYVAEFARDGALSTERLTELHTDLAETWGPVAERFVALCTGDLEPAEPRRPQLPLTH
jgi:GMP synthase-like glutamine amidotransferase